MKSITALIVLSVVCVGCQTHSGKLHAVDMSDDVSQSEALIIGQYYSDKHLAGGKIDHAEDRGDHWEILGRLGGYLPKPLSFDIDKHSGKITSQVGPSYDRPPDIYR